MDSYFGLRMYVWAKLVPTMYVLQLRYVTYRQQVCLPYNKKHFCLNFLVFATFVYQLTRRVDEALKPED